MENKSKKKLKVIAKIGAISLVFGLGSVVGNKIHRHYFDSIFVPLIFAPSGVTFEIQEKLSSANEFERICGYYALNDYRLLENDLLIQRYLQETDFVKRNIISLLANCDYSEILVELLKIEKNEQLQKYILEKTKKLSSKQIPDCQLKL